MNDKCIKLEEECIRLDTCRQLMQDKLAIEEKRCWQLICENGELKEKNEKLRTRLLSAAGDDLCRLTQEEIKEYTSGKVKIPPKEEFISSCEKFHAQIAGKAGVFDGCLTLAQLIAENTKLEKENTILRRFHDKVGCAGNPECYVCNFLKGE